MNLTIIGATGMVGTRLLSEALRRGHHVTAAARRPTQHKAPQVRALTVDVTSGENLDAAFSGTEAAILSIRPAPGQEETLAPLTSRVLDAAARADTPVLVIGGAGPLRSPSRPDLLVAEDPAYVPAAWRPVAGASTAQLHACEAHDHASWTYLSPPAILEPGVRTGRYRRGTTTLLTHPEGSSRISAEDLAVAALDEIESPGPDRHFTVVAEAGPDSSVTAAPLSRAARQHKEAL
ncbi:hypothetical protein EV191_1011487 [Tamaricihabitans halophyticus]|uniref:NAD(P)-binding domain-containing protein n=1 Tax=Tamaricihabitans halophyticus TaxID=1262583 RepID=A0A4R2R3V3_9PSEU|nr:NAD(P)H-binding protein [Tamaricihabitans halophyticus]TCP57530.1 hypothetical protein EV191_1011487 [Tamaricihabitans halophyticus]